MKIEITKEQYQKAIKKAKKWQDAAPEKEPTSDQHGIRTYEERVDVTLEGIIAEVACDNLFKKLEFDYEFKGDDQGTIDFIVEGRTIQVKGTKHEKGVFYFRKKDWEKYGRQFPEDCDFGLLVIINEQTLVMDVKKWITRNDFNTNWQLTDLPNPKFTDNVMAVRQYDMQSFDLLIPILRNHSIDEPDSLTEKFSEFFD